MTRPKQYLIDECDSNVIDYIGQLEAERDTLQAKLDRLWDAFTAITEQNSVYEPADLEDSLGRIFTGDDQG